ncbi:GNAT family N-acetyltransferase [Pseudoalteromonas shioyasakiensis]|uniref:GNAT family N-acetyltransferase n=1 Tax=Pseudoalteromonas shioyasakiensis TaxID=1190813 RepID=UPI0021178752|nr:GNAT family N-acetyltransferase [Pseudoalteromonas shioyasakiensis]MCQ8880072.1 GNAT family N-acetyltransferase [Pseudoalteromonas shioyasakiensis]
MLDDKLKVEFNAPTIEEYIFLREKVGWGEVDEQMASISLHNSLFHVVIRQKQRLIGMGRVIGDGGLFFYVQDVVVSPDLQGQGIGTLIMDNIEEYLSGIAKKGATVGLFSVKGRESFYNRYSYRDRPNTVLGCGMCKFI